MIITLKFSKNNRSIVERIETAIKSNRISEPIEIITNDTVVVNQVEPAQKKK